MTASTASRILENNLDIAVQRFLHPIAEADVLRTSVGNFLERHNIDYDKALQGRLWKK